MTAHLAAAAAQDSQQRHAKYDRLIAAAQALPKLRVAVAHPCDDVSLRAALEAAGFGMPLPWVFVAPAGTGVPEEAASALRLDVSGSAEEQRALAARAWPLEQTADAYRHFIATFEPLAAELQAGAGLTDLEAMVARVLLIHDYRRIVLRDPILPPAILPEDWPGLAARAVCADIYGRLVDASERWLDENAVGEDGAALPADPKIANRFKV